MSIKDESGQPSTLRVERTLDDLRWHHRERFPRSAAIHEAASHYLPGGNTRTPIFYEPFPIAIDSGRGCRIVDVDGNEYVDLVNNYTSLVHGHAPAAIETALASAVASGWIFGAPTALEESFCRSLASRIDSLQSVRITNSGTEAVLYAVRTARYFTGRSVLAKAEGGYHGGVESLQVGVKQPGTTPNAVAEAGVAPGMVEDTVVFPIDDVDGAKRVLYGVGNDLAAIIVEPILGSGGCIPLGREFLTHLANSARELGALLIFDEVMSFRLSYGGMQELYGIQPDITTLGKVIGGGLPIGAFGGRADIMASIDPRQVPRFYHAGTFNGNRLSLVAGLRSLELLTPAAIDRLNQAGDDLRGELARVFRGVGLPFMISGQGSLAQIHEGDQPPRSFADAWRRPHALVECLHLLLLRHGIFIAPRGSLCVSTVMSDGDYQMVIDGFERASQELVERMR